MSTATSLSQQSQLAENAYLSLTGAIRGKGSFRSGSDVQDDEGYHNALFASQTWSFVQQRQAGAEFER